jgi:hypothetical protein
MPADRVERLSGSTVTAVLVVEALTLVTLWALGSYFGG